MPSPFGAGPAHEKKIGHRRVDASGETTYKKVRFGFSVSLSLSLLYLTRLACPYESIKQTSHSAFPLQTTSSALKGAIQLGIGYTVGNLSSKPERDVLMQDFYVVESIFFPRCVCMLKVDWKESAHHHFNCSFFFNVNHFWRRKESPSFGICGCILLG